MIVERLHAAGFGRIIEEQRQDLTATVNPPLIASNQYRVFSYLVPVGQVFYVQSIQPTAFRRINVGAANEQIQYLSEADVVGELRYNVRIGASQGGGLQVNTNFVQERTAAAANLNNNDRATPSSGIAHVSSTPYLDALRTISEAPLVVVKGGSTLEIVFSLQSTASANPLQQLQVGTGTRRVDYAGALVLGLYGSLQEYESVIKDTQRSQK